VINNNNNNNNNHRAGEKNKENVCFQHLFGGTEKITENAVKIVVVPSSYPTTHPQLQAIDVITVAIFLAADISTPKSFTIPK
jgi:hypothetical protein